MGYPPLLLPRSRNKRNVENVQIEYKDPFFELLGNTKRNDSLVGIVKKLCEAFHEEMYEFSFATKLLHTVNPKSPIYDSKVISYLKHYEGVDFWNMQKRQALPDKP